MAFSTIPNDEIIITVGVSEALYLAMTAVLNPGDEVIIPEPCFVSYAPEVSFAGGVPVMVPTYVENQFEVTAEDIEAAVHRQNQSHLPRLPQQPHRRRHEPRTDARKSRPSPNNTICSSFPTKFTTNWSTAWNTPASPALPGMRDRTILLGGFSKDYAMTGWRIGYACANPELLGAMRKVHQYTIMSAPTTAQAAAVAALEEGARPRRPAWWPNMIAAAALLVDGFNTLGLDCFEPKGRFLRLPLRRRQRHEQRQIRQDAAGGRGSRRRSRRSVRRKRRRFCPRLLRDLLRENRRSPESD